jgi:hypothetical protein
MPVANRFKTKIVFTVQPQLAIAFVADEKMRIALFADFLARLARRYPSVKEFVIGNEPNERLFLQPQHGPGGVIRS